jgi:hypothetical protein
VAASKPSSRRPSRKQVGTGGPKQASLNAGLGGAGGGTGLVAIAHVVGLHTILGQLLLYVSPTISVVAGTVLYHMRLQTDWYSMRWQIKRARRTLEELLAYPHTSEEHKAEIRKMLEKLDHVVAEDALSRVKPPSL